MTIQAKHPNLNYTRPDTGRDAAEPRQRTRSTPIDWAAGYALVSCLIIWGSFILAFWPFL